MKKRSHFLLRLSGLSLGDHAFSYPLLPGFIMQHAPESEALRLGPCQGALLLKVSKNKQLISLKLHITGQISLCCDRSLRAYEEPLAIEKNMWIKWETTASESTDEDIFTLPRESEALSLDQVVYELIALSIPLQRLHPDYRNQPMPEEGLQLYTTIPSTEESRNLSTQRPFQSLQAQIEAKKTKHIHAS